MKKKTESTRVVKDGDGKVIETVITTIIEEDI